MMISFIKSLLKIYTEHWKFLNAEISGGVMNVSMAGLEPAKKNEFLSNLC